MGDRSRNQGGRGKLDTHGPNKLFQYLIKHALIGQNGIAGILAQDQRKMHQDVAIAWGGVSLSVPVQLLHTTVL